LHKNISDLDYNDLLLMINRSMNIMFKVNFQPAKKLKACDIFSLKDFKNFSTKNLINSNFNFEEWKFSLLMLTITIISMKNFKKKISILRFKSLPKINAKYNLIILILIGIIDLP